jgi:malate dehydrogenase (quinone)
MYFAKQLGIAGIETQSLLLVAGNFYYTPKYLNAKVYTLQNPKLPFSAVHGDPDILNQETKTRYGPTTRIVAQLERGRFATTFEYLTTLSPVAASVGAYMRILFDREFFFYAVKHNVLFLLPGVGNYLFAKEVRKIIPTIKTSDIERAKGQGGVRPQIVQTAKRNPLSLGEVKLQAEGISFNVTPSPGASTCVYNGLSDIKRITQTLEGSFYEYKMEADFGRSLIQ